eukprot:347536-Rhodomonas_salina.1
MAGTDLRSITTRRKRESDEEYWTKLLEVRPPTAYVLGLGFRARGLGYRARVQGLGHGAYGIGPRV